MKGGDRRHCARDGTRVCRICSHQCQCTAAHGRQRTAAQRASIVDTASTKSATAASASPPEALSLARLSRMAPMASRERKRS